MRLLGVKFSGGFLEGLELNFELKGEAARFVVLAGENGMGKTTILNAISNFGHDMPCPVNEYIWSLEQQDVEEILKIESENSAISGYHSQNLSPADFGEHPTLIIRKKQNNFPNNYTVELPGGKRFDFTHGVSALRSNAMQIFLSGIMFKIWHNNIEPKMQEVNSVSNYDIDNVDNKQGKDVVDLNNGIDIPQLLVDLDNKDAVEFRNSFNRTGSADSSLANRRMDRFKKAFSNFFDNQLTFKEVCPDHKVIFSKNGREFSMDGLSTGEKIIVQCGASLLKDAGANNLINTIAIDEPEQALHPRWQERIIDFYAESTSLGDDRLPQIIVTTHSEHVLKNALLRDDALVILLSTDTESKKVQATKMLPDKYVLRRISYNEIKYRVFGILSADYHDELLGYIQEMSGLCCKDQDAILVNDESCPKKHWAGKNKDGSRKHGLDTESLPMHIRHYVHHPELRDKTDNIPFSDEELASSTNFLEEYIKNTMDTEEI